MIFRLVVGLIFVAQAAVAAPTAWSIGEGTEVAIVSSSVTGTYSGTTSSASAASRIATRAFFDMPYWQVALSYSLLTLGTQSTTGTSDVHHFVVSLTDLGLGGMLKLPITSGIFTLYPFAGLDYFLNVGFLDDKGNNLGSTVPLDGMLRRGGPWISVGIGADLLTYDIFHFRIEAAFCINPLESGDPLRATDSLGTIDLISAKQGVLLRVFSSWRLQ